MEKCKGTGTVASVDVFEARALGWYLKPQSEKIDASGKYKRQPQLIEGKAHLANTEKDAASGD